MADQTLQNTLQTGSAQDKKKAYDPKRRRAMMDMLNSGEDPGFVKYNHVMHGYDQAEAEDAINTYYQVTGKKNPLGTKPSDNIDLSGASALERQSVADMDSTIQMAKEAQTMAKFSSTGPLAGRAQQVESSLPGGGDKEFNELNAKLSNIKSNFMKALSGAAVSEQEVKRLSKFLPDVTDQEEVIQIKLEALASELETRKKNTLKSLGIDTEGTAPEQPAQKSVDDQAYEWLQSNPEDPRAEKIRAKLESKGYQPVQTAPEEPVQESPLVDPDTGEIKSKGFFETIGEEVPKFFGSVAGRVGDAMGDVEAEAAQGKAPSLTGRAGLRAAGVVAGTVSDAFKAVFNIGVSALPDEVRDTAGKTMEAVLATDTGKAGLFALQQGQEAFEDFKSRNPEIAKDIEDVANIAMAIPAGKVLGGVTKEGKNIVGDTAKVTNTIIGKEPVAKANDMIFRAVKPSVTGGKKINQVKQTMETATRELVDRGYSPKNFQEYAESLTKAKADVWKEVEAQVGASGARVNLRSIADEVTAMADDATIGRVDPNAAKRIKKIADSLVSQGDDVSVAEAESLKQYINGELKGTFGKFNLSASETNAKKLITAKLGQQLDEVLSSVPGEFSGLKKAYGALSQAEEEAMKRLVVFGRQNPASLVESFSKISGIGNIIKGIVTASPADVARGAGEIVLGKMQKSANSADDMIRKAFEGIKGSEEGFKSKLFNVRPGMNTVSTENITGLNEAITQTTKNLETATKRGATKSVISKLNKQLDELYKKRGSLK